MKSLGRLGFCFAGKLESAEAVGGHGTLSLRLSARNENDSGIVKTFVCMAKNAQETEAWLHDLQACSCPTTEKSERISERASYRRTQGELTALSEQPSKIVKRAALPPLPPPRPSIVAKEASSKSGTNVIICASAIALGGALVLGIFSSVGDMHSP